jgi:hypothetical protein
VSFRALAQYWNISGRDIMGNAAPRIEPDDSPSVTSRQCVIRRFCDSNWGGMG